MTLRSMAMPMSAGQQEGERKGDQQRIVEKIGRRIADDVLHDEGHIGADHHHLAMRHVDDAHDAEGDGKADGGKQQHRTETQAIDGVLHILPEARSRSSEARASRAASAPAPCRCATVARSDIGILVAALP